MECFIEEVDAKKFKFRRSIKIETHIMNCRKILCVKFLSCTTVFFYLCLPGLSQATPSVYANTYWTNGESFYEGVGIPNKGIVSSAGAFNDGVRSGNATASSAYGVVKTFATASRSSRIDDSTSFDALGIAGFIDDITIAYYDGVTGVELYHGQWALASYDYYFRYSQSATTTNPNSSKYDPVSYINFHAKMLLSNGGAAADESFTAIDHAGIGTTYTYAHSTSFGTIDTENLVAPMNVFHVQGYIQLGIPFSVQFQSAAGAGGDPPYGGNSITSLTADASHSGYWAGIKSVSLDDVQLQNYTVTSASGTDYTHSMVPVSEIPEPSSTALLLAGAFGIGWSVRKTMSGRMRKRA